MYTCVECAMYSSHMQRSCGNYYMYVYGRSYCFFRASIVFDKIYIREDLVYDKYSSKVIGLINLGEFD